MARRGRLRTWLRGARLLSLLGLFSVLGCGAAAAQVAYPQTSSVDSNGVNLVTGQLQLATRDVSIGRAGAGKLTYSRTLNLTGSAGIQSNPVWRDNLSDGISSPDGVNYSVVFHGVTDNFTLSGGTFTSLQGYGTSLSYNSTTGVYTYTTRMGTIVTYSTAALGPVVVPSSTLVASIASVAYPSGTVDTYTYKTVNLCAPGGGSCANYSRLQSLTNNFGYQLKLSYSLNSPSTTNDVAAWQTLTQVTAINNAVDYCDPTADTCSGFTTTWPSTTYSSSTVGSTVTETITDALGRASTLTMAPQNGSSVNYVTQIQSPWSGANPTTITYNSANQVASVSNGVGTWTYAYSTASGVETTTVTDPLGHQSVVTSNTSTGLVAGVADALGRTTSFSYDTNGRMTGVTKPGGAQVQYTYDGRGNITQTTAIAAPGSGLSNIVASASYDATCTSQVKCNKPNATFDANGNETDYTYDTTLGALLTVTGPAPTTGAVRPQARLTYSPLYAWYKNSSGSVVQAASPISLLASTSTCQTTASCAGTSDEVKTTVTYGTSGVANNLIATATAKGAGDGSLTATTSATYDAFGNKATATPPLGSSQTSAYFYDADHELIGAVGPNPGGGLANRAVRLTYDPNGHVTLSETGTAASQSYTDWQSLTSLEQRATTYDAVGRVIKKTMASGGTTQTLAQYDYDNANRVTCVAARINPATFGSEPSSACSQGTPVGSAHDRITAYSYDNAGEVTQVTQGYGTSIATTIWTKTFTADGLTASLLDANGNLTSYTYDGFDRATQVNFPLPTLNAGASNPSDYESVTYDANGNVLSDRKRDGTTLSYTYDALNRPTQKAVPGGASTVNYAYDLLNRTTSATYATGGQSVSYAFDALNRVTSETSAGLTVSYQHDLDGNLTKMTWPDGFYAEYAYDALNRMSTIQDSSGGYTGAYVTYSYDNRGRRTQIARGNGTSTSYAYDNADRLVSLTQDVPGSGAVTYGAGYNTVSQVLSSSVTNSAYISHPSNPSTSYTANGLNQYSSVGGTSFTYDTKGNLTSDGTRGFSYDAENRLTGATIGTQSVSLSYDPAGRLNETVGSSTSQFVFSGQRLIAEYDGAGHVLRRYVPGSGLDNPVIWYEGSGYTSRNWLHTDPHGSVIAYTNDSGAVQASYGYGPYGEPNSWSGSRYRYTGQIEIPEVQLYYYKARVYDPAYGRFPQTDPVGYRSNTNAYGYAHNDPVNRKDPGGLCDGNVPEGSQPNPGGLLGATIAPFAGGLVDDATAASSSTPINPNGGITVNPDGSLTSADPATAAALASIAASAGDGSGNAGSAQAAGDAGVDAAASAGATLPTLTQLTNILYNENASLSGADLVIAETQQAYAIMNGAALGLGFGPDETAPYTLSGVPSGDAYAISVMAAANAYFGLIPDSTNGSPYYNNRSTASMAPNFNYVGNPTPYMQFGPYSNSLGGVAYIDFYPKNN